MNGRKRASIASGLVAIVVASIIPTGPTSARPLEGDGVPSPPGACSSLQRFVIDATGGHPAEKAKAIIGLEGDDADDELARIRAAVAASCT